MASTFVCSSLRISSEYASAVAYSALRYGISDDVGILTAVMPIRNLRQMQRQVLFADLMEGADHLTLQQAPKAVQVEEEKGDRLLNWAFS